MKLVRRAVLGMLCMLATTAAFAQVQTGSIAGVATDTSNAVMPGVTVSVSGEKLIGGVQTQTTDASGAYRFDRLPPGSYNVKFELQGFRSIDRADVAISAAFTATVNAKLEVGSVTETITVTGESPTVDTHSNLQQTVMNQEILEGVPSGRDPWSIAKIIPGVQVSTYDVGGTQSIQQSNLSSHGSSTNDVSYNIDGASVNWPGGGGGATMLYYDQGMFEEVNYMTSAIPAEMMAGGVSINMVTKDAGNKWRGDTRYNFSSGCLDPKNPTPGCLESDNVPYPGFLGNPTQTTYDFNVAGGGALIKDRLWVNGSIRRWIVDKLVNSKNDDGTQAIDDNVLKNYSGKGAYSISSNQKVSVSYNWNNKIRGHRRDTPPNLVPDIASLVQTNPASSTQAKYTGIHNKLVYESSFSIMSGITSYNYQPNTPATAVRIVDTPADSANFAAQRHEDQPNSRLQFDNSVSISKSGLGGDHVFKGGIQFAQLKYESNYDVLNGMYLNYNNGVPVNVQEFNTPADSLNRENVLGLFLQDAWTAGRHLTINLGMRYDHNTGILPDQSAPGGLFSPARTVSYSEPIHQGLAVWRTGLVYDPFADGATALKASYSRYGLQVGIDRVTNVNPLTIGSRTCPWTDPNRDGIAQASEINTAQCTAFPSLTVHYAGANGPRWPYSDEVTAGIERQLIKDMRVGVMYYHRTNRDQIGVSNTAVPASFYTPVQVTIPNGPGGTVASPKPQTVTVYNLSSASYVNLSNLTYDNQPFLDTVYNGVEFTANKRMSKRWQMVAGLTLGHNRGGVNTATNTGQSAATTADLNDPNVTAYGNSIIGNDSDWAFRLSGSYQLPWSLNFAATFVANQGYPFISTFSVNRTLVPTLVRSTQTVLLSSRGDERYPDPKLLDIRFSRAFSFGPGRKIVPQIDIFNLGNSNAVTSLNVGVGSSYLVPNGIISPRIARIGFAVNF
ncbi:MAG: TonB-dependent receptor [Acidobacteria bacterium]|nr:TonB-dependent receptor [Acidobacteriota bacterium]